MLSEQELERYDRQMMIKGFGPEGQEKLKGAKVLIAGAGGLGSPISIYLAVAGVGRLTIADYDTVALSNLNRQISHWDKDVDRRKVDSAREKLLGLNSDITVNAVSDKIETDNVDDIVGDNDLIVDAMDNVPTRLLLNEVAIKKNIPIFHGAVYGFYGRVTTIIPGVTPCLRCLYPKIPPSSKFPVVGVTPADHRSYNTVVHGPHGSGASKMPMLDSIVAVCSVMRK
jgi:molybdopterin/thiamine biosynthesis adenylyltransferase